MVRGCKRGGYGRAERTRRSLRNKKGRGKRDKIEREREKVEKKSKGVNEKIDTDSHFLWVPKGVAGVDRREMVWREATKRGRAVRLYFHPAVC